MSMQPQKTPQTRKDIALFLAAIGKPGEKRDEKRTAIEKFHMKNLQGHNLELTLETYGEY